MKLLWKVLVPAFLGLWSVVVFMASNGPSDVQARAEGWLRSPLLRRVPVAVLEFASSRLVIALTALAVGGVVGWIVRKWWTASKRPSWHSKLATDMAMLAYNIEQAGWRQDALERLNSELMLVNLGARRNGLAFPTREEGFNTLNDFLPYLHRVSALLRNGEVAGAREVAQAFSEKPQPRPEGVF